MKQQLMRTSQNEFALRRLVERMALLWQAATLIQYSDAEIAEPFVISRLAPEHGYMYGTLPQQVDFRAIIERAKPKL